MKRNLTKLMLVAFMAILPLSFYAQKKQNVPVERYFYIFAEGGLSINHTDLANYGFIPFYQDLNRDGKPEFVLNDGYVFKNFDGQLGIGYQLGKVIGINAKYGTGTISGQKFDQELLEIDAPAVATAVKPFVDAELDKTTFMEANLNFTFNLSNLFFGYNPRRVFNFIPHVGIGGIRYHAGTVTKPDGSTIAAKTDPEMTFTVPVGAELNFNLARKLDFFIDYTFTWAGNDKLDQVQKVNDNIEVINDMYSSLNAGLRFKFNKKGCTIENLACNEIEMRVNPTQLVKNEDKVCFDLIVKVPANYFEKDAVLNITPVMTYKGGQLDLAPMVLTGEKVSGGDNKVNKKDGGEFTKSYCVDFKDGMENGKLVVTPVFYTYNGNLYANQEEIINNSSCYNQCGDKTLANGVLVPVVTCDIDNITATADEDNITVRWNGNADSYDIYVGTDVPGTPTATVKTNSYTLNGAEPGSYNVYVKCTNIEGEWVAGPTVKIVKIEPITFFFEYKDAHYKESTIGNREAKAQLIARLTSGEPVNNIRLEGWASPEGEMDFNQDLSKDRADEIVRIIRNMKEYKGGDLNAIGKGEAFDEFKVLFGNSSISGKDSYLNVLNHATSVSDRERAIESIRNAFNAQLNNKKNGIFPKLRRVDVYIE